jgi:hypothetical protein
MIAGTVSHMHMHIALDRTARDERLTAQELRSALTASCKHDHGSYPEGYAKHPCLKRLTCDDARERPGFA